MVRMGQGRSIRFGADAMNSRTLGAGHTQRLDNDETPDEPRDGDSPGPDEDPTSVVVGITLAVMIGAVLWIGVLTIAGLLL